MKILNILLLLTFLASCSTIRYDIEKSNYDSVNKQNSHFFLFGIGQTSQHNAVKVCGSEEKITRVDTKQTALNIVFSVITSGLYTPRSVFIYCKD